MLDKTALQFSHVKPGDTDFRGEGLRDFFLYRDLGVAEATAGKVLAQLVGQSSHRRRAPDGTVMRRNSTSSSCSRAGRGSCTRTRRRWSPPAIASTNAPESCTTCSITRPTWSTSRSSGRRISSTVDVKAPCEVPAPKAVAQAKSASCVTAR